MIELWMKSSMVSRSIRDSLQIHVLQCKLSPTTEMRIHRGSVVFRPIWHLLRSVYLFFSVHFVEEKTFSSLGICFQMCTKMSRNAPKVIHFIKNLIGGGGMPPDPPPDPPSICALRSLNRSRNSHPSLFSICCSYLCHHVQIAGVRVAWGTPLAPIMLSGMMTSGGSVRVIVHTWRHRSSSRHS